MARRLKVVITDHVFHSVETERELLEKVGADLEVHQCGSAEEVAAVVTEADGVLTCYAPVRRAAIEGMTRCRIIARYGIGVDNVDLEAATAKGIVVTNVPDYCVDEVSDHALAMILACARRLVQLNDAVRQGVWEFKQVGPMFRLKGRILGLLGAGKIARRLADKAQALGLRCIAYDPFLHPDAFPPNVGRVEDLDGLAEQADFISIHCPLTDETRGLVNARFLAKTKPTAFVVNTARGEIVDFPALLSALRAGRPAGAALDVLPNYKTDCAALRDPANADVAARIVLTPHSAFYSEEAMGELQRRAAEEVARVLGGEPAVNIVNRQGLAARARQ